MNKLNPTAAGAPAPAAPPAPSNTPPSDSALTIDDMFPSAAGNRRGEPRIAAQRPIGILPCTGKDRWELKTVMLLDCAPHGIAILSDTAMHRGDEFVVRLLAHRTILVMYRVSRCAETDSGKYKIGARLVERVDTPDEILKRLLEHEEALSPQRPR